jgi:hypothetical protein
MTNVNNRPFKKMIAVCFALTALAIAPPVYCQPFFYSQSLQNLYYSLPASCRLNTPATDTVVHCSGIVPDGAAPVAFCWDEYEMLAHVGYRFLNYAEMLQNFNPAVIRFLEREILALLVTDNLEQKLTMNRDNGISIAVNGNTPQKAFYRSRDGLPRLLQYVSGINIRYEDGKNYRVDINCGQEQTLTFTFVADAELLSDMDKKERDDQIAAQLRYHRAKPDAAPAHVPECSDATMQTYRDSAFVCKGGSFIIPQINGNIYYMKTGSAFRPVFGKNWIAETLSNVMLAPAERNYTVQITQRVYGGEIRRYELNSRDFFDYFSENCDRYFGIETVERDILTGTLILADKNVGNIHIAFVSISVLDLLSGGTMKIQLDANIPKHNVETIFGKKKEGKQQIFKEIK